MGRAWPQTASKTRAFDKDLPVQVLRTIKKEVIFVSRMCFIVYVKSINPERSMVAARKPWDRPGLKQHQMGINPEGFKSKIHNVPW